MSGQKLNWRLRRLNNHLVVDLIQLALTWIWTLLTQQGLIFVCLWNMSVKLLQSQRSLHLVFLCAKTQGAAHCKVLLKYFSPFLLNNFINLKYSQCGGAKFQVFEIESCFHRHEKWNFCAKRKTFFRKLVAGQILRELSYLFRRKWKYMEERQESLNTKRMFLWCPNTCRNCFPLHTLAQD